MVKVKPDLIERVYYRKGDIAKELGVYPSAVGYWERYFGDKIYCKKRKGIRLYDAKGLEFFRRIYQLIKVERYTLEGARQIIENGR